MTDIKEYEANRYRQGWVEVSEDVAAWIEKFDVEIANIGVPVARVADITVAADVAYYEENFELSEQLSAIVDGNGNPRHYF